MTRPGRTSPEIAVLITGCEDLPSVVRGYRTVLPRAQVFLYGADLPPGVLAAAEAAGATVRVVQPANRDLLVRRMFAEVEADIYILAHGIDGADVCVAPSMVAQIDHAEMDLITLSRIGERLHRDRGDRLLSRTVAFLFGRGGDGLASDVMACSRRFARSYKGGDGTASPALHLSLHALRLRMPVGDVAALGRPREPATPRRARDLAGWAALVRLVVRLLVEERPRRVFGLAGFAILVAGIAVALPSLTIQDGRAALPPAPATLVSLALLACGAAVGTAGLLLDTLAKARQEVKRLGYLAIPRRAEPTPRR